MTGLIAAGHIIGAIIVLLIIGFLYLGFVAWLDNLNVNNYIQELSLNLGIPKDEIENQDHQDKIIEYGAKRHSTELLRNRISDLFGFVLMGWGWLSNLLQAGILIGVIWMTVTDDLSNSIYAWWIVGVAIFFSIISICGSLICKFLTGRYPGQARLSRKQLASLIEARAEIPPQEY